MLRWVFDKFKTVLLALAVIAGPVLYIIGSMRGRKADEAEDNARLAKSHEQRAAFYREMENAHAQIDRPADRDALTKRLRSQGL